jgi:hypothetical protein
MIESPWLQEIIAEERLKVCRKVIVTVLTSRFGLPAGEVETDLKSIEDDDRLEELIRVAASCRSLKAFRKHLSS